MLLKGQGRDPHSCHHHPRPVHLSLGYSSLKSRLFRVVQSRILRTLMTMSFPCQRPFQSCREAEGSGHLAEPGMGEPPPHLCRGRAGQWSWEQHLSGLVLVEFVAQAQLPEVNPRQLVQGPVT